MKYLAFGITIVHENSMTFLALNRITVSQVPSKYSATLVSVHETVE